MKNERLVRARIMTLKQQVRVLQQKNIELLEDKRYGDVAKNMQQESNTKDQIALLEWVLKD